VVLLLFAGTTFKVWDVRVNLARDDYRDDVDYWEEISALIEPGARTLSLSTAYGFPLSYYGWLANDAWLNSDDVEMRLLAGESQDEIEQRLFARIEGYDYFVITRLKELNKNAQLKELLYNTYPILAEGDGYIIFDLTANSAP
jgi:hypothetical protein